MCVIAENFAKKRGERELGVPDLDRRMRARARRCREGSPQMSETISRPRSCASEKGMGGWGLVGVAQGRRLPQPKNGGASEGGRYGSAPPLAIVATCRAQSESDRKPPCGVEADRFRTFCP